MPEVTPYRDQIAPELGSNIGTDAMISAARRVGPLEREAGLMVSQGAGAIATAAKDVLAQREAVAARQEIAGGLENFAMMHGQHTQDLQKILGETDPSKFQETLQNFKQNVLDPETQKWAQGFQTQAGQEWAQMHGAQQAGELLSHAHTTMDAIAANQAVVALDNSKNQFAANAIADPTSIQRQIDAYTSGAKAIAATMTDPVKRTQFEKAAQHGASEIAYAGVHSAIEVNPGIGTQLQKQFAQYLTPEHQTAAETYANAVTRANATQARLDRQQLRQDQSDQFNRGVESWMTSLVDPQTQQPRLPADAMQNLIRLTTLPGAAHEPGMVHTMINMIHTIQAEAARGTPTATDVATYNDFASRQFLGPEDPNQLTLQQVAEARTKQQLSDHDAAMFRQNLDDFSKNPALAVDQKDLGQLLNNQKPQTGDVKDNTAFYTYEKETTDKFWFGRRQGIPARDLLDPKSKDFIGFMSDAQKADAAVSTAQQRAPATVMQQKVSSAADLAVVVTNLARNNSPEDVKTILKGAGMEVPTNFGTGGPWCAPLVNSALKAAGLDTSGSGLASSFKDWGFQVEAANAQKGDVFYVPADGYTGHVGILTGQKRVGPNGEPQVQVVSSHLQGQPPGGDGGVEWRNVSNMTLRRAKPPLEDIKPGAMGKVWGALKYMTGGAGQE